MENEQFESYYDRAYEFDEQEEPEKALKAINQAIEFDHSSAEAHNFRGILLEKLGRKEEAVLAYEKAAQLDPDSIDVMENLAGLKAELEKEQKKKTRFRRALIGAGIGAYAFGMSFLLYGIISGGFRSLATLSPDLIPTEMPGVFIIGTPESLANDVYDYLFLFLRMLACGIGLSFINRDVNKQSFKVGFLIGFLGCGIAEMLFTFYSATGFLWFPNSLVGVFVGLLLGLSQKKPTLLLLFSLAGGISFGLEPTIKDLSINLVLNNFSGAEKLTLIFSLGLMGLLSGILKGICFGSVAGWYSTGDQTPAIITSK